MSRVRVVRKGEPENETGIPELSVWDTDKRELFEV